jgi:hypothetical protein
MRHSNRVRLSVNPLEGREVPACVVALGGPDTLVITGDGASDAVVIKDNGAGTVWGTATGAGAFSFSGIKNIQVATGDGSDRVVYNLVRNMLPDQQRVVNVWLGDGRDSFIANLHHTTPNGAVVGSDLLHDSSLIFGIFGGAGSDYQRINANHDVDVGANARLKMVMYGEEGNDTLLGYYRGENDGSTSFREFDGGRGDDIIRGHLKEDFGSTGVSAGIVHGGDGNDKLALFLVTQNPPLQGLLDGGAGLDSEVHTPNVTVVNVP